MAARRHFFAYAYHAVTAAPLYHLWQSVLAFVRRFRLIAFLLRLLGILIAALQTGALVLLTTALFLIILPLLLLLGLGVLLTALVDSRRANRHFGRELKGKTVYVLFLHTSSSAFLQQNVADLSHRGAVLLISAHWLAPDGWSKSGFYCTARKEATNIYWIRKYYFYQLRRHVLRPEDTVLIY